MTERRKKIGEQGRKFMEAARALQCDESEERFDEALRKVAGHKPSEEKPHKRKEKKPVE